MAQRGENRRGSRATSSSSRSFPSRGRGGRHRAPKGPTDEDATRGIQQSALRVALELCPVALEAKPLQDICLDFERTFETQRSSAVTARHDVRVELLECGLDKWQHVVEMQRVLAALKGLEENGEQLQLKAETVLKQDVKTKKATLSLAFAGVSVDAVWRIANSLMLRLKSCEVLSRVLLPTNRLVVPLLSLGVECSNVEGNRYQWEGRLVWSQVVLDAVVGEQREEIQRVVLPPFDAAPQSFSVAQLRYPGLVALVDEMVRSNSGSGKPVVIVMRGIPGSGKSTLGKEIAALCRYKKVPFTICSADTYFTTPRGYVFDGKQLSAAHERCRFDFKKAVTGAISEGNKQSSCYQHIVLVENTSTQKWEYAPYEAIAHTYGCRVYIVEMKCPDVMTAFRMGQRNHHGVPPRKVVSMFMRWEEDSRAHSFTPRFEHALLSGNPLSDSDAGNLIYIGLFLEEKAKTKLVDQIRLVHTKKFADHVTLFYQPNLQYVRDVELGAPFSVRGVEVVQNDRGQTLRVEIDEKLHLQVRNKIPHITLSTAYRVSPVYSNELLSNTLAKRTAVDPPLDLSARIGAVLNIEGEQVITTRSPFDADAVDYGVDHLRCATGNDVSPQTNTRTSSKLFILHVKESDFADKSEVRTMELLGMAKVLYQMGSGCKARLLCTQQGQTSSLPVSVLMKRVQARFHLSATQSFDDVVSFHEPTGFDETISKFLDAASLGPHHQVVILTTDAEVLQWPLCEIKCFQNAALSVSRIGLKSVVVRNILALRSPCTTIFAVLDSLGINTEEQTQSIVLRGIGIIDNAWKRVTRDNGALYRMDSTIVSMSSPVVDLCLVLPSETSLIEVATLQETLLRELSAVRSVQHVVFDSNVPGRFYFSLCTASSYTPAFCVQMTSMSEDCSSEFDNYAAVQLNCWQQILQSSRKLCDVEPYSVMTILVRAILVSHCSSLLPSKCRLSSLVNLISERLVLHYFKSIESCGEVDAVPTAADVVSSQIVCSLYRMLIYLSKVSTEEWPAIFGTSLQTLQGNQKARTEWSRTMENVMRTCATVMAENPCVAKVLRKSASLYLKDHLRVIFALIKVPVDKADNASYVRAVVIVSSHVMWSQVHSFALCDKLRSAAALLVSQDDDNDKDDTSTGDENEGSRVFFSCVPSVVARRIDVTTSSLQVLRDVMTKMDAVEPAENDGTRRQAEIEGWLGFDLCQSQVDMQWHAEEYDSSTSC
uniref:tRNA ligase phosphodiesterase domain-containing protein n=1 Tax=Peronospora matthiolae TaxID=2874970 RepID=A0AAV1TW92_9STRA